MKLESRPDDLCGNCWHNFHHHGVTVSQCWSEDPPGLVVCPCREFVPPIMSRLVEALEEHLLLSIGHSDPVRLGAKVDQRGADLLVELGRMTCENGVYRWSGGGRS